MGAGILPTTIHNNKLYFLFGKENQYEDSAPGFSDFGGGTDDKETFYETALREACEELTGFLGNKNDIKKLLKPGTYNIDYQVQNNTHKKYRMHIFYYPYNEYLPFYYNNNQKFLQTHLSPEVIKSTKIFEKAEIRWICVDDLKKMRPQFRSYFQNIVDTILLEKNHIRNFIDKKMAKKRNKTIKKR
jgi:8-oxo-dGTP pyrophosphatase MutT (NUDIX family)